MQDLKQQKSKKIKENRRKKTQRPLDWVKLLRGSLRVILATGTGCILVFGAVLTAQLLLDSGYFNVNQVRVEHNLRVSEGEVLAASDIQVGDSLFDLDLHMIGAKIEEHPWVARAEVERVFPDNVVIRILERVPRAIIDLDYLYYVDDEGEVFKVLDHRDTLDFPVLTGISRQTLLDNEQSARRWLLSALALVAELESRTVFKLADVSQIHYDEQLGLIIYTYRNGVPVHMGSADFVDKLNRLERIYPDLEPRLAALAYIDLNVADRVIVKIDSRRTTGRT